MIKKEPAKKEPERLGTTSQPRLTSAIDAMWARLLLMGWPRLVVVILAFGAQGILTGLLRFRF